MVTFADLLDAIVEIAPHGVTGAPKALVCVNIYKKYRPGIYAITKEIKDAVKAGILEDDDGILWITPSIYYCNL